MLAFESLFPVWKVLTFKRKIWNIFFRINFQCERGQKINTCTQKLTEVGLVYRTEHKKAITIKV